MKRPESSACISTELKAFLESGVSVVVGTRDAELVPEITRAWGLVSKDRKSISLCAPIATSRKTLQKTDPSRADLEAVERHREAFGRMNELLGFPRQRSEIFWQREVESSPALVKLRLVPEQIFDQTPGPDAGSRL